MVQLHDTILIVDDDQDMRSSLKRMLLRKGKAKVLVAESGDEALSILEHHDVTVVLSDLKMPKMDGICLLSQIKARYPDTARVMLTGYATMDGMSECLHNRIANRFLTKPITRSRLNAEIATVIDMRRSRIHVRQKTRRLESHAKSLELSVQELQQSVTDERRYLDALQQQHKTVMHVARQLSKEQDTPFLLRKILYLSMEHAHADGGTVWVLETKGDGNDRLRARFATTSSCSIDFEESVVPITQQSIVTHAARTGETVRIADAYDIPDSMPYSFDPSFDTETGYRTRSILAIPMIGRTNNMIGVLQLINRIGEDGKTILPFPSSVAQVAEVITGLAAIAIEQKHASEQLEKQLDSFVKAAVSAIELRDPSTAGHSLRVASYSTLLARYLNHDETHFPDTRLSPDELRSLEYAGLLHDFGKVYINEEILRKEKKLYPWDFENIMLKLDFLSLGQENHLLKVENHFLREKDPHIQSAFYAISDESGTRTHERIEEIGRIISDINDGNIHHEKTLRMVNDELNQLSLSLFKEEAPTVLPYSVLEQLKTAKGTLTSTERARVESHVTYTYNFLCKVFWPKQYRRIPEICLAHHERLDGSGYPSGLQGGDIPLEAQILAIADVFDALTAADRPYRKSLSIDGALDVLEDEVKKNRLNEKLFLLFKEKKVWQQYALSAST